MNIGAVSSYSTLKTVLLIEQVWLDKPRSVMKSTQVNMTSSLIPDCPVVTTNTAGTLKYELSLSLKFHIFKVIWTIRCFMILITAIQFYGNGTILMKKMILRKARKSDIFIISLALSDFLAVFNSLIGGYREDISRVDFNLPKS